jgi:hypothetical protein
MHTALYTNPNSLSPRVSISLKKVEIEVRGAHWSSTDETVYWMEFFVRGQYEFSDWCFHFMPCHLLYGTVHVMKITSMPRSITIADVSIASRVLIQFAYESDTRIRGNRQGI